MEDFFITLGTDAARDNTTYERELGVYGDDVLRHVYLVGKTGTGKTTLLEQFAVDAIRSGQGLCFIDPHGDAVSRLVEHVPRHRTREVVWLDPSDMDWPLAFNPLDGVAPDVRARTTDGIVAAFTHLWGDSWGPRLHDILYNTIYSLIEDGSASLAMIPRFLNSEEYRDKVLLRVTQPDVLAYWREEYANYKEHFRVEVTASTLNKVRRLLVHPEIKNIIGQRKNKLHLRDIMDRGGVLLVDLSKGKLGAEATNLLGALLINQLNTKALERADMPEEKRQPFFLVVDEFQNFGTDIFRETLSESRKYRLGLVLAHQYVGQIDPTIRKAVFGNVGSLITFRVGAEDAETLYKELDCGEEYLMELSRFQARVRLTAGGNVQNARTMTTKMRDFDYVGNGESIRKETRRRYCKKRDAVEAAFRRL